jgi:hypothetical protein
MQGDDILRAELKLAIAECERLRAESAQFKARLGDLAPSTPVVTLATSQTPKTRLPKTSNADSPADQKANRFRSLFRGREDVYAVRWEGKNGRTGYSPAGIRDWEGRLSQKLPRRNHFLSASPFPLSDDVVRDHLLGKVHRYKPAGIVLEQRIATIFTISTPRTLMERAADSWPQI